MRLIILLVLAIVRLPADRIPSNWMGNFEPCARRSELLKHDHMDLGVRVLTSNPELAREFKNAMSFWASVLDMTWHEENTAECSLQLVDGRSELFRDGMVARAQFTEWLNFQGWIAFDPKAPLTDGEMYLTAVHEIGHLFGLKHNPSARSVMYYLDLDGQELLERSDLVSLAEHHKLRDPAVSGPIRAVNEAGLAGDGLHLKRFGSHHVRNHR